jgi:Bacterial archaeo-eukaryotic release factor family 3
MTQLTTTRIQALDRSNDECRGPHLSFFLPVDTGNHGKQINRIRLRNLIREARQIMQKKDVRPSSADELIDRVERCLDGFRSPSLETNLAIFVAQGQYHEIQVPTDLSEEVYCGNRFYLEPLIEARDRLHQYFALVVEPNGAKVYFGDSMGLKPISAGLPPLTPSNAHERGRDSLGHTPRSDARDKTNEGSARYLDTLSNALEAMLKGRSSKLILFGTGRLTNPIAVRLSKTNQTVQLNGQYDRLNPEMLHLLAWPEVVQLAEELRLKRISELEEENPLKAVRGVTITRDAARAGRVARLFIRQVVDSQQQERVEEAALATLRFGGDITVCAPGTLASPLAAVLRY